MKWKRLGLCGYWNLVLGSRSSSRYLADTLSIWIRHWHVPIIPSSRALGSQKVLYCGKPTWKQLYNFRTSYSFCKVSEIEKSFQNFVIYKNQRTSIPLLTRNNFLYFHIEFCCYMQPIIQLQRDIEFSSWFLGHNKITSHVVDK